MTLLAVGDQDGIIFNTFIDDLLRLSQIKQELQSCFLLDNFFVGEAYCNLSLRIKNNRS